MSFKPITHDYKVRLIVLISVIPFLVFILSGCNLLQSSSEEVDKSTIPDTEVTVYSTFDDEYFYTFYGNYILQKYPNIKFRLIKSTSSSSEIAVEEIKKYKPDLVITWNKNFQKLKDLGSLSDLTTFINSDEMNLENYYTEMIASLKNDFGQLNGLAPLVNAYGVYYNKNLFDVNKVAYPTDRMTWDEMLQLTMRFTGTDTLGMEGLSPASLLRHIARTKGWKIVDEQRNELLFNQSAWTEAITMVLNTSRNNNVQNNSDLFLQGKSAMYFGMLDMVPKLQQQQAFTWGIVTTPVDAEARNLNSEIFFNDIFCIPNDAVQKEVAWEIIKAVMSEDAVSYLQRNSNTGAVSTLKQHMNQYNGVDLTTLWQQELDTRPYLSDKLSTTFIDSFDSMLDSVITLALQTNMSPKECLNKIVEQSKVIYQNELIDSKQ
ncbi:extracellular solute-binding protein [Paenibacillus sp. sptzw28]|uniref:ABC transporter substrate-binding protein n=1 Tax=Paenibacillus sp. sptzw28 TaxID=715179 RepID=UPI001C6E1A0B|nr:extracellular solute-binding protein [Paenibacillus sp. sptzw28]QYR21112.1 extracellular solute-binding protein [Paenibacillus sp. sptzw28]